MTRTLQKKTKMKLIIGCPIYNRSWIFPYWVHMIERQSFPISDIGFVFIASAEDHETLKHIETWANVGQRMDFVDVVVPENVNHYSHEEGSRQWTISKYDNMCRLRNALLSRVRYHSPDYFFSLDSDILIENPSTIELLIAHIKDGADAVSPLMYMTPVGVNYPSVMKWHSEPGGKAHRDFMFPIGTYFKSDVIMAAKMMSRAVYENIDYKIHEQGEDLGWSANCAKAGYSLYSASYLYAPHIMSQGMLAKYLESGDERREIVLNSLSKV